MSEAAAQVSVRSAVLVPLEGAHSSSTVMSFHHLADGKEHVAVVFPGLDGQLPLNDHGDLAPLVRIHSECLTGDVLGSLRCDCGPQLRESIERLSREGGVLLYLRQEGRGIGLYNKLAAYLLQDGGADTFEANLQLNLPADPRDFSVAADMLKGLGLRRIRLLSNNPAKAQHLVNAGIDVTEFVSTGVHVTPENERYLRAKQADGHELVLADPSTPDAAVLDLSRRHGADDLMSTIRVAPPVIGGARDDLEHVSG